MVDDPAFKANVIDNPRSWFNDQRVVSHIVRRLVCEYGYAGKVSDTYDERGEYSFRVPYDVCGFRKFWTLISGNSDHFVLGI